MVAVVVPPQSTNRSEGIYSPARRRWAICLAVHLFRWHPVYGTLHAPFSRVLCGANVATGTGQTTTGCGRLSQVNTPNFRSLREGMMSGLMEQHIAAIKDASRKLDRQQNLWVRTGG